MKRSYLITLDEPDVGEVEPVLLENERGMLAALIRGASNGAVHVTVSHATGLPLHPRPVTADRRPQTADRRPGGKAMKADACPNCRRTMRSLAFSWRRHRDTFCPPLDRVAAACLRLAISYRDGCNHQARPR